MNLKRAKSLLMWKMSPNCCEQIALANIPADTELLIEVVGVEVVENGDCSARAVSQAYSRLVLRPVSRRYRAMICPTLVLV